MSESIKQQVDELELESQSIFSRMKKIKQKVASVNRAMQKDEVFKADSDLLDKMIGICDELGLGPDAKIVEIEPAACHWCTGGGGK